MPRGTFVCRACGAKTGVGEIIGRRDTCDRCGADLHSCIQCRHYDTSYSNDCREPQAELVTDKEKANFCDYFQPAQSGPQTDDKNLSRSEAEKRWEELFAKK